jgi:hypothetical protein
MTVIDADALPPTLAAAHRQMMLIDAEGVLATDDEARRYAAPPLYSPEERAFVLRIKATLLSERNITPAEQAQLWDLFKRGGASPYAMLDSPRYFRRLSAMKRLGREARRRGEW